MGITILLPHNIVRRIKQSNVLTSLIKSVRIVHSCFFILKQLEVIEALNGNVCKRARIISLLNSTVISKTWMYEHITISFVPYTQYLTGNRYGSEQVSTRRGIFGQQQLQCKLSSCCIIFKLPWRVNLPAKVGDIRGWIPGWERSPGGGHDNPFQYGKSPWTEEHEGLYSIVSQRVRHN